MPTDSASPDKSRPRANLRSLFAWTFCVAVGAAIGADRTGGASDDFSAFRVDVSHLNWHYALLASASTGIAMGLFHQAWTIRQESRKLQSSEQVLRFDLWFACAWRLAAAALLTIGLAWQMLNARGFMTLPESSLYFYSDLLTVHGWWLLLIILLIEATGRAKSPMSAGPPRRVLNALAWIGMSLFGAYVIINTALITYLVHVACRGVDATNQYTGNRYPIWFVSQESTFAGLGLTAVVAVILAAFLLCSGIRSQANRGWQRYMRILPGLMLLAAAGAYCSWYYRVALPTVSPDLGATEFGSTWFEQIGGVALGLMLITAGATRTARTAARGSQSPSRQIHLPAAAESLAVLVFLASATGLIVVQSIRGCFDSAYGTASEMLPYLLVYPDTTLTAAILILALHQMWLRRKGGSPAPLHLVPLEGKRLASAWLALAAILSIGIPTLAAFSFSFWLGPWYRW
jgi:hypothetical protein